MHPDALDQGTSIIVAGAVAQRGLLVGSASGEEAGRRMPVGCDSAPHDRFGREVLQFETGWNMRILRFLGRILKRALADISKSANQTANTGSNRIDKFTGGSPGSMGGGPLG